MRKLAFSFLLFLALPVAAQNAPFHGVCENGGRPAAVSGINSTNTLLGVVPSCLVTVYYHGTSTLVTIYSDAGGDTLGNPFTADALGSAAPGSWAFYAPSGTAYDITMSNSTTSPPPGFSTPVTVTEQASGSSSGSGVTSFSSGDLSPLFTTSVDTPMTTPAQTFTLSTTGNFNFFGNFSGSTATPSWWTLVAGAGVSITTPGGNVLKVSAPSSTLQVAASSPIEVNGGAGPVDNGTATISCPTCGDLGSDLQFTPTPPISGQYVVITPTAAALIQGGLGPGCGGTAATGSSVIGNSLSSVIAGNTSCGNGLTNNTWGASWTFAGALAAQAPQVVPANVTAVYAFSLNSFGPYFPGTSFTSVSCTPPGSGPVALNGSNSWSLAQFTALLTTATGSNVDSTTCTATTLYSTPIPSGTDTTLNVPSIGLIVYYTGTAPAAQTAVSVVPPLNYNPASNSLFIDPNAVFSSDLLLPVSVAQLALMSPFPADQLMAVYNAANSSTCTSGGGTTYVQCLSTGTAWVPYSGSPFITSLTTTGSSGPATVAGGVLNIPEYTGSGGSTQYPPVSGATAEYPMTNGSGTAVTDISGNGNNATFCSGSNAPSWYTYGVAFLDTATNTSTYTHQCVNTPLTNWGTAYFAYCTPTMTQTTGISVGGTPAESYPTLFGSSSGTTGGILWLANPVSPNNGNVNAFQSSIFNRTASTATTVLADAYGNCHVYGFSAGSSADLLTVDGVQPPNYSAQGASGSIVSISGGVYQIGAGNDADVNALRGVVAYGVIFPTAHTLAQMSQESKYIQNILNQRPTFPAYPVRNNARAAQLVFGGDSLTAGYLGSSAWTATLSLNGTYTVTNWGIGGMTAIDVCKTAEQRWEQTVVPGQSVVHVWAGTNDAESGYIPSSAWTSLVSCVAKAHSLGAKILVATMISRTGTPTAPGYSTFDQYKDALNPIIRSNWQAAGFDGLVDLAEVAALGADGASTNTNCFQSGVHLTGPGSGSCATIDTTALSGYGIVAALVSCAVNTLNGSSAANPDQSTSNSFVEGCGNSYIVQTPSGSATHTLVDCQGLVTPRTIVNGSASNTITVQAVNSQTITGSTSVAANSTGKFLPVLTGNTTGGCSWVRVQ